MSSKHNLHRTSGRGWKRQGVTLLTALGLMLQGAAFAESYRVQKGDTLEVIAKRNGTTITAIQQINPGLQDPRRLQAGQTIELPGRGGTAAKPPTYTVKTGDTLSGVATREGLHIDALKAVNPQLRSPYTLKVGQVLQLPVSGRTATNSTPTVNAAGYGLGTWLMPLQGVITSGFGWRHLFGKREMHDGIDIRARVGTPIKSSRAGVVRESHFDNRIGWGGTVLIDHGNGWTSRYGHLSKLHVKVGQQIPVGFVIGLAGNTGRSTGPHLHYSVYHNGRAVDPMTLK